MAIRTRLLNRTVDIKSFGKATKSTSGDFTSDPTDIETDVKCRITSNSNDGSGSVPDNIITRSTHLVFFNLPVTIVTGYYIVDDTNNETFKVIFVDKSPGGELSSHYEVYAEFVEEML